MYAVYVQVTSVRAGRYGVPTPKGASPLLFSKTPTPAPTSNQLIQWAPGVQFPGIKRPERKDNHTPLTHAEELREIHLHVPYMSARREQGLYLLRPSNKA